MFLKEERTDLKEMAKIATKEQEEQPIHPQQEDEIKKYHADYVVLDPAIHHNMFF